MDASRHGQAPTQSQSQSHPQPPQPLRGNEIFRRLKMEVLDASDPSAMFPKAAPSTEVDSTALHNRLVSLTKCYLDASSRDLFSASLYSYLALTFYPQSVPARRCRAQALLLAGQGATFPFTPHRSQRGAAAAAINVLEQGPPDVFADTECAELWAQACRLLGRDKEAEEVLTWCVQGREVGSSTSAAPATTSTDDTNTASASASASALPQLATLAQRKEAIALIELADLHRTSRKYAEAEKQLNEARRRDPWNWRAWVNLSELGVAPMAHASFGDQIVQHLPLAFLDSAIVSLGGDTASERQQKVSSSSAAAPVPAAAKQQPSQHDASNQAAAEDAPPQLRSTSQHVRPGSRVTAGQDATSGTTAKRTKSIPPTAGQRNTTTARSNLNGEAAGTATADRHVAPTATTTTTRTSAMTRTLSQARTNERPPSTSGSSAPSDGDPEKEKELAQARGVVAEPVNVTKDSLRRSTRSQAGGTTAGNTGGVAAATRKGVSSTRGAGPKREGEVSSARTAVTGAGRGTATAARTTHTRSGEQNAAVQRRQRVAERSGANGANGTDGTARQHANGAEGAAGTATLRRAKSSSLLRAGKTAAAATGETATATTAANAATLDEVAANVRKSTLQKAADEAARWQRVDVEVLRCLRLLGGAYKDAKEHKGDRVLRAFSTLDSGLSASNLRSLQESPEVKILFGRVHHDMAQYVEAEQCFAAAVRSSSGTCLADMDIYSLVLFHLSRQEKLSALAQQLARIDADAAETHLTSGNLFSLNASPSIALRCFRRACQSAPHYAHSYTLAGHECRALNQPLKALRFFREALRVDPRHWNGWSGIGMLLCSEGQWKGARTVLAHACGLNPSNAQLWDVFGIASEQVNDRQAALEAYSRATLLNPKSAGATIRKGELLWKMNRLEPAHNALLQAVALSPNEAQVHLRLAQSYMRKGGGAFAPISVARPGGGGGKPAAADDSVTLGGGVGVGSGKAKAMGESALPTRYHAEIARHLATAVDLEPSLSRRVKALTEGAGATLRGGATTSAAAGNVDANGFRQPPSAFNHPPHFADRSVGSSFSGIDQSYQYDDDDEGEDGEEGEMYEGDETYEGYTLDEAGRSDEGSTANAEHAQANTQVAGGGGDDSALAAEEMVGIVASGALDDDSMNVLQDEDGGGGEGGEQDLPSDEDGEEDEDDGDDGSEDGDGENDSEHSEREEGGAVVGDVEADADADGAATYDDDSAELVEASFAQGLQGHHGGFADVDASADQEAEMSLE